MLALQAAAYKDVEPYPLDVLGAQTEGMIGYLIEQELGNLLPAEVPFATILTMIEVDATIRRSTIRPSSSARSTTTPRQSALAAEKGWVFKRDGDQLAPRRALAATEADLRDPSDPLAAWTTMCS